MTVTAIPTTTVVGLSSNSVAVGGTATITAFVGSSAGVPQGSVTFYRKGSRALVPPRWLTAGIISISGCGTTAPIKMAPTGSQTMTITATEGAQVQAASIVASISQ